MYHGNRILKSSCRQPKKGELKSIVNSSTGICEGKLCRKFSPKFELPLGWSHQPDSSHYCCSQLQLKSRCCSLKPILNILPASAMLLQPAHIESLLNSKYPGECCIWSVVNIATFKWCTSDLSIMQVAAQSEKQSRKCSLLPYYSTTHSHSPLPRHSQFRLGHSLHPNRLWGPRRH